MKTSESIQSKRFNTSVQIENNGDINSITIKMDNLYLLHVKYLEMCIGQWHYGMECDHGFMNLIEHITELRDTFRKEMIDKLVDPKHKGASKMKVFELEYDKWKKPNLSKH